MRFDSDINFTFICIFDKSRNIKTVTSTQWRKIHRFRSLNFEGPFFAYTSQYIQNVQRSGHASYSQITNESSLI